MSGPGRAYIASAWPGLPRDTRPLAVAKCGLVWPRFAFALSGAISYPHWRRQTAST